MPGERSALTRDIGVPSCREGAGICHAPYTEDTTDGLGDNKRLFIIATHGASAVDTSRNRALMGAGTSQSRRSNRVDQSKYHSNANGKQHPERECKKGECNGRYGCDQPINKHIRNANRKEGGYWKIRV